MGVCNRKNKQAMVTMSSKAETLFNCTMAGPFLLIVATVAFDEQHLGQSGTALCAEEIGFRKCEPLI